MKRVMILLLMINITNATFCEVPEANSWLLPVFIALFIGLLLSIIGYFVSLFLNSPKMAAWAKVEVSHLGTAAFVAILIYGVMTFSCDNNATLVLGASFWPTPYNESITPQNFFNASADYFDGVANTSYKAIKMMRYNLAVAYVRASISAFGSHPHSGGAYGIIQLLGGPSTSWSKFPDAYVQVSMFQMVLRTATVAFFNILFLKAVFSYISTGVLTVMLPAGIVLYAIPLTKNIGGALIALAVGLFVFYPAMFAILDIYWLPYVQSEWEVADVPTLTEVTGFTSHIALSDLVSADVWDWCKQPEYIYPVGTYSTCDSGDTGFNNCYIRIYDFMSYTGILTLSTVFFPYLAIIVAGALTREVSKIMGQELDITRLATML
ncbi:hypothetical protein J7J90_03435 [Candidatus Micrarchaeota archaeon]|nr:hypothetical protein [Candidatus Micrarchaeota archaeon]